jgi:hypothetical protein
MQPVLDAPCPDGQGSGSRDRVISRSATRGAL